MKRGESPGENKGGENLSCGEPQKETSSEKAYGKVARLGKKGDLPEGGEGEGGGTLASLEIDEKAISRIRKKKNKILVREERKEKTSKWTGGRTEPVELREMGGGGGGGWGTVRVRGKKRNPAQIKSIG